MKRIGIIAAMSKELDLLLPLMTDTALTSANGFEFHSGIIAGQQVTAMQCGIGKVNAAIGCMTLIDTFAPDLIINTGVAGGTGADAHVMDIVVADAIAYHDVWCGPGTVPGQAAGCPKTFTPPAHLLRLPCLKRNPDVKFGLVASGDIFVDSADTVARILHLYPHALAVDMESAALAQTCAIRRVPFLCMRVVSDTPGAVTDNATQYCDFWNDAPRHAFRLVTEIINDL